MKYLRKLFHRHTWRKLKVEYRYRDYTTGRKVAVYRCQCRDCNKISRLRFFEKEIIY